MEESEYDAADSLNETREEAVNVISNLSVKLDYQEDTVEAANMRKEGESAQTENEEALVNKSEPRSEEELHLIRSLLKAEESHDAGKLLDAHDHILSSTIADGLEDEIKHSPTLQNTQTLRESLKESPFKAHNADFGELTKTSESQDMSYVHEETGMSPNASASYATPEKSVDEPNEIPRDGLTDEECASFVGTYEENQLVNKMIGQLNMNEFQLVFREDPVFKDEFRWWARACVRARRYRLGRAIDLLKNYANWRKSVVLYNADTSKLKAQLETGFCMFLEDARCTDGRAIILVRLKLHEPSNYSAQDVVIALHNVILYALRSDELIQAKGFTVLHDMTSVRYRNLDFSLAEHLSRCLNSTFPMRYGRLLIYNPPFFFSAAFRIVSIFLSKKMRDRMIKLSKNSKNPAFVVLAKYINQSELPSYLGGAQELNSIQFATNVVSGLYPISKSLEMTITHNMS